VENRKGGNKGNAKKAGNTGRRDQRPGTSSKAKNTKKRAQANSRCGGEKNVLGEIVSEEKKFITSVKGTLKR